MADVAESTSFTDPVTAILQGKRHLLVRDYDMAVTALAQACELLASKHGDSCDELGEPYLLYGRALLGLAREEAGVLGGGVPGSEEVIEEDDEDEEEDGDEDDDGDNEKENGNDSRETKEEDDKETKKVDDKDAKKTDEEDVKKADEKDAKIADEKDAKSADEKDAMKADNKESEKADDIETEVESTTKAAKTEEQKDTVPVSVAGSSKSTDQNGDAAKGEKTSNEEDDVNNLQVAWEVLELAKLVLLKRGPPGWKNLAEAHRLLGEVAMESGNHQGALIDLKACLDLLNKIDPVEPRAVAEIHYQLGLAYSLGNEFDSSVAEFNKATELLEKRIKELEGLKEDEHPKSDDPFYSVKGEIEELKELLPEIEEKIADMKDFKQETQRLLVEGIKNHVAAGSSSNGAGPSHEESAGTSSDVKKPASDISHLVKRKRPATENEKEDSGTNPSPCKKPTPEKAV